MKPNDKILDDAIAQALGIERDNKRTLRKLIKLLREANKEILDRVATSNITEYEARRVNQLVAGIREILRATYIAAGDEFETDLQDLVRSEIVKTNKLLDSSVGVQWSAAPSVNRAYAAAYARPFQGALLRDRWKRLPEALATRIERQLRLGYLEGETQNQIATRVRRVLTGTQENWARVEVNTAISHFQNFAHRRVFEQNKDALKGLKLVAVIDTKTSDICQERDNRVYQIDRAPNLPFHMNCRSVYVPVLKDARAQRFAHLLDSETRASLDGQIPADTNFKQWIGRQSFSRQAEAVGVKRAQLLREGLAPEKLYGSSRLLTVAELTKKFPDEAKKAFG